MFKIHLLLITTFIFLSGSMNAQDTLPGFSVNNYNKKVIISWFNKYPQRVKGISIQRSYDSSKSFSSIASAPNPVYAANYFIDERPPYNKMFYRLFITFDSGGYVFSESKRAVPDTAFNFAELVKKIAEENKPKTASSKKIDNIINSLSPAEKKDMLKALQDSKTENDPDTKAAAEEIIPYKPNIYLGNENNVIINITDFEPDRYDIKFYDENNKLLFQLNKLKEGYLIIEKVNFLHAGWFQFEIYDGGLLIEKNRFYIPK